MGKKVAPKVVIDTNVLVSALLFGGTPGRLRDLWQASRIRPLISREIMGEYLRVLAYPRFRLAKDDIAYLLEAEILPSFEVVSVEQGGRFVANDPEDDKFIWCALAGNAGAIISGDEHLLALPDSPVPVVAASEFLRRFR